MERAKLNFRAIAKEAFAFLGGLGFLETESSPTIIRFKKDDVEIDIYQGRQSYEVGLGVTYLGTRYSLVEIIRAADPVAAREYRNPVAKTREDVADILDGLGALFKQYGFRVLRGDAGFFALLNDQRKSWADEYALDVLVDQLRPKADEAFRLGNYPEAVELYERIQSRLSATEQKKLALAKERILFGK